MGTLFSVRNRDFNREEIRTMRQKRLRDTTTGACSDHVGTSDISMERLTVCLARIQKIAAE